MGFTRALRRPTCHAIGSTTSTARTPTMGGKQSKQGTPPAQCCGDCAKPLPKRAEKGGGGTGEVVDGKGPVSIIVAYDIFGFKENPRTREVCDEIASKVGSRVVMPDFFRGEDVLQKFGSFPPPGGVPAVVEWFNSRAPFDKVIEEIDSIVIPYLKEQGACKAIGGVGFCWGGNVCIQGARKLKDLKAIAALHSNIQTKEDVADLDVPIALFQSGDDPKAASRGDAQGQTLLRQVRREGLPGYVPRVESARGHERRQVQCAGERRNPEDVRLLQGRHVIDNDGWDGDEWG